MCPGEEMTDDAVLKTVSKCWAADPAENVQLSDRWSRFQAALSPFDDERVKPISCPVISYTIGAKLVFWGLFEDRIFRMGIFTSIYSQIRWRIQSSGHLEWTSNLWFFSADVSEVFSAALVWERRDEILKCNSCQRDGIHFHGNEMVSLLCPL